MLVNQNLKYQSSASSHIRREPDWGGGEDISRGKGGSLVEDGDTAQLATVPFRLVLGELGIDGLEEGAHERDLVGRTDDVALEVVVLDC